MTKWLLKTEPASYSYDNLEKDKKTRWDGVTNPYAMKYIRSAKEGDLAFIYHTGDEKQIVGIAKIVSEPYPDPRYNDERFYVFDIVPYKRLKKPVTLKSIKAEKRFTDSKLVRAPRLSVQPVSEELWDYIIKMSK
ncbi:MAG: EVE domain-containing protein [Ignavibacteria bacterium]|nr:EVE domain-containing protein [Ignavibacteria bacterium]